MRQVNFSVDDRVYSALEKRGREHGYKPVAYAKMLFEAAFACRVGVSSDADLDAHISAVIVLHGAKLDTAAISKVVRLSEATVVKVIDAWRQERLAA